MVKKNRVTYEMSVSGRSDGTLEAAYIRLREGKVAKTVEVQEGVLLCDYDARGNLLGIEVLAPVKLSKLVDQVNSTARRSFKKFVNASAPDELVHT